MKIILMMFIFWGSSLTAHAMRFSSKIHSFGFGKNSEPHLVRFDNSRVSFLDTANRDLLNALMASKEKKEMIEVEIDKDNNLIAAQTVVPSALEEDIEDSQSWSTEPFEPTVVSSYNSALNILENMRNDLREKGECYNRAHVWAYEEYKDSGNKLMKIFMFFTERYIRHYRFEWWFHVTPMVYWGDMDSPRTLDRKYTSGPRQTKVWSDIFIRSKRRCQKVATFNEYFLNQEDEDCYHVYTSMYYVIPRDIEKRDLTGVEKTEFNENEIKRAYRNAFKGEAM